MAFQAAANWHNLPNGVFSPTIFSRKAQKAFRKSSVVEGITNSDYFGEISAFGDSVRIIKEPEIIVRQYARGTSLVRQDLVDEDFSLIVDKANYFMFGVDDIEEKQSHVNWMDMATDRAGYKMRDTYDSEVLAYMSGYVWNRDTGLWTVNTTPTGTPNQSTAGTDEWLTRNKLTRADFVAGGATTDSIAVGTTGTYDATPLQILNRMNRKLNELNVDKEGRWVVVDPVFVEKLLDENSKLVNADYAPGQNGNEGLFNGQLSANKIRGFTIYESNNLPRIGNGPGNPDTNGNATDYGIILAGHNSAVATASQLKQTEKYRDPDSFGDLVRGMQLYGRKILRSEALVRAVYNINA
jgi:hypothetical protein